MVKNIDDTCFDTIRERDGQTDGETRTTA